MRMMRTLWLGLVMLLALGLSPGRAQAREVLGGQYRYWVFSDNDDLRDVLAYYSNHNVFAQLEYWDFVSSKDQFRPELGFNIWGRHRSVYTIHWRHEHDQERFMFGTEQVLGKQWVGRAQVDPIVSDHAKTLIVAQVGADYYWGSYNFASATVIRDPRSDGFWTFPVRVRLANESNDWLQLTVAPATERTIGWATDVKYRSLRLGVEHNSRYDFTDVDNIIYTIGFERELHWFEPAREE